MLGGCRFNAAALHGRIQPELDKVEGEHSVCAYISMGSNASQLTEKSLGYNVHGWDGTTGD
jgi:hypothetical protein